MSESTPPSAGWPAGWVTYLLRCADGTLYCGCTNNLARRLARHQHGAVKYTRGRLPVAVAYVEPTAGRGAALSREAALKRLPRAQKLRLCSSSPNAAHAEAGDRKKAGSVLC